MCGYWVSTHALAQCPALRVLELSNYVSLESPGTFEEALEELEDSSLQLLKLHYNSPEVSTVRSPSEVLLHVVLLAFVPV